MSAPVRERPGPSAAVVDSPSRRPDIQGLRAIAVLLVVLFHAELPVPGGFAGVDVFFVISGFVITAMLMREWARFGRIAFGRFYLRRFLRLTPALALAVAVVALLSFALQSPFGPQQTTARTGIGAMLLSANYVIGHGAGDYFAASAVTNPLLHTWSLSVEEQFYLVFPALLVLGWVLARRRAHAAVALVAVITMGSFAVSMLWSYGSPLASPITDYFGGPESFAFYSSLTRAWEFGAGALLALVLSRLPALRRGPMTVIGVVGAALVVLAAATIRDDQPFPGLAALIPVVGTVLLILAGAQGGSAVSTGLSSAPLVWIGDRSYSWYLWHWPLIVFAALLYPNRPWVLVAAAAVSLLPAMLSYRYVEQPLRLLRPRTRGRALAVAVPVVGIPLALSAALLVGAGTGWGLAPDASSGVAASARPSPATGDDPSTGGQAGSDRPEQSDRPAAQDVQDVQDAQDVQDGEVAGGEGGSLRSQHVVVRADCVNSGFQPDRCRFGPPDARGTILLAGDSQAYALADGVIAAGERIGLDTVATSRTGCPFLARESSGVHNYPCRSWQRDIVDWALAERPEVVVITNRSGGYVRPGKDWRTVARDDGSRADSVDEAAELYRRGLEPVVRDLTAAAIPVVLVAAVPEMTGYTDRTSLFAQALGSQAFERSRAEAEDDRAPALDVERDLAATYPGVTVFDPIPALCGDEVCSTDRDGQPVYQDETHLSVPGALLLVDGFEEAIAAATGSRSAQG